MNDAEFEAMQTEMAAMREAVQLARIHRRENPIRSTGLCKSKTQRAGFGARIDLGEQAVPAASAPDTVSAPEPTTLPTAPAATVGTPAVADETAGTCSDEGEGAAPPPAAKDAASPLAVLLAEHGLDEYAALLEENAVTIADVGELTSGDLIEMGIAKLMHRKNMLRAFEAYRKAT